MGNDRQVDWSGHWSRTTEKGLVVNHDSNLIIQVDVSSECRTATGSATTTVAGREVDTTIKDYKICIDPATNTEECPSGSVTYTRKLTGKSLDIDFDGTNEATVEAAGQSFMVPLVCGQ
jgi:hypothetical protein